MHFIITNNQSKIHYFILHVQKQVVTLFFTVFISLFMFLHVFFFLTQGDGFTFEGVEVITDFVSPEEEKWLMTQVDSIEWIKSQSGRRKQVIRIHQSVTVIVHL